MPPGECVGPRTFADLESVLARSRNAGYVWEALQLWNLALENSGRSGEKQKQGVVAKLMEDDKFQVRMELSSPN